jgi:hypothetical protein
MTMNKSSDDAEFEIPAGYFPRLEDIGQPAGLCSLLSPKHRNLVVISGMEPIEVRRTMAAMARSFMVSGTSASFLNTGGSEPLPGVPEVRAGVGSLEKMLMADRLKQVLFLDSLDVKEKMAFAMNAAMSSRTVIVPVPSYYEDDVISRLIDLEVNKYQLADLLRYIAQQTILEDPFSPSGSTVLDIHISMIDIKWKQKIWQYKK